MAVALTLCHIEIPCPTHWDFWCFYTLSEVELLLPNTSCVLQLHIFNTSFLSLVVGWGDVTDVISYYLILVY